MCWFCKVLRRSVISLLMIGWWMRILMCVLLVMKWFFEKRFIFENLFGSILLLMRFIVLRMRSFCLFRLFVCLICVIVFWLWEFCYRIICMSFGCCLIFCCLMCLVILRFLISGFWVKIEIRIWLCSSCIRCCGFFCFVVLRVMWRRVFYLRRRWMFILVCWRCKWSGIREFWKRILMLLMV